MKKYTVVDFQKHFPADAACLEWLKEYRYPNGITCKLALSFLILVGMVLVADGFGL